MAGNAEPHLFQLTARHLPVVFSTTGIDGKPHLSYDDGITGTSSSGDQIRLSGPDTDLQTATVTIRPTVDSGSATFTLLVPRVVLPGGAPTTIHTVGIITGHRHSPILALNVGQLDSYRAVALSGTACIVQF